jgi:hypothetical protein
VRACLQLLQPLVVPPVSRVEHQDVRVLPPGRHGVHGAQPERRGDALRRVARRAAAADQVRRPVVLHGAVVVAEPEGEEALALGDGAPVLLVYAGAARARLLVPVVGDGRGQHAQHGLPLVPPDGVAHEHQPPVPEHLQQPPRVESDTHTHIKYICAITGICLGLDHLAVRNGTSAARSASAAMPTRRSRRPACRSPCTGTPRRRTGTARARRAARRRRAAAPTPRPRTCCRSGRRPRRSTSRCRRQLPSSRAHPRPPGPGPGRPRA